MSKILLILLAIFLCSYRVFTLTEDEAIARIDRVVYISIYQLNSTKNMLSDGSCCGERNADSTCAPCKMTLVIIRMDSSGEKATFRVYESSKPVSSFVGYITSGQNVDSKIYTAYNLAHRVKDSIKLYDSWLGVNPKVVGVYPMNGVYGENFNSLLFAAWSVSSPLPYMPYYSMVFTIRNIEWIYDPPKSGSMCPKASPFIISAMVEDVSVWKSQIHRYDGTNCSYVVKFTGGTDNAVILKENALLTLNFNEITAKAPLIDTIIIKNINTEDNKRSLEFLRQVGTSGKIKIDIEIKYNCKGYVGKNCVFPCQPIDDITDCKPEDGARYCKNGADDLKLCSAFTNTCHSKPCAHEAECIAFRTGYFCNCTEGWSGRDCRDSICHQLCYKGVCGIDNYCSCISGYGGRWCEKTSCLETDGLSCKNGGVCMRMRDVATCICPPFTSGNDCSNLICIPVCKMGKCEIKPNSNFGAVQCTCASGYTGSACEILISAPSIFRPRNYIYAISGLSIALALSVKIMVAIFLIPYLSKTDKTESNKPII